MTEPIDVTDFYRIEFFEHVPMGLLVELNSLGEQCQYPAQSWLFREGEAAERIYILLEGSVGITMGTDDGRDIAVATIAPDESFGWSALVPPYNFTASAIALEPVEVVEIRGDAIRELCTNEPCLGEAILQGIASVVSKRLEQTRFQLIEALDASSSANLVSVG